jgi:uncharacterized phosphosugar-binding protein
MIEFLEKLHTYIEKISSEEERIKKAAEIIITAMEKNHAVHFWGPGGHSSIFAEDVLYREGELANINPIIDPNISLSHGAMKEINYFERIEGIGKAIVRSNRIKKEDVIVIGSPYGVNPVCIEGALACKDLGAIVIAITSPAFSDYLQNDETRHKSRKSLFHIADYYIDSHTPEDDLTLYSKKLNRKYGPVGTILQLITLKALTTTVIKISADREIEIPLWMNALEKGGVDYNDQFMNKIWCKVKAL